MKAKLLKPKYIIILSLLIIALSFSFVTRTRSFDEIFSFDLEESGIYSIIFTRWKSEPEQYSYDINLDEAQKVVDVLDDYNYKLYIGLRSFYEDSSDEHYSYILKKHSEGIGSVRLTVYPDGRITYNNQTYILSFEDNKEAVEAEKRMEEIHQWLLDKEEISLK